MQYNSPVILTFFLLSLGVLFLGQYTGGWTTTHLFSVYRSSLKDPLFYIRLFGHVLGHGSWDHFLNNMLLLLVVGPPMEEKYGSLPLLKGILLTALISGILQCALFPRTALLGASGIVFMLIMLASLSGFSGGIPVTMLLVAALYLGQQVYDIIFVRDNVANFMHIVGGVCGTVFGRQCGAAQETETLALSGAMTERAAKNKQILSFARFCRLLFDGQRSIISFVQIFPFEFSQNHQM